MQAADHADREAALAVQDLHNAGSRADERLETLSREALLLHADLDRLDRIRRVHGIVLGLIGVDQRRQDVEAVIPGVPLLAPQRRSTSARARS